jgi:hypothetical protein
MPGMARMNSAETCRGAKLREFAHEMPRWPMELRERMS